MKGPTRREVVIAAASAGLAGAGAFLLKRPHVALQALAQATTAPLTIPRDLLVLADAEYLALAAACERVFPRDAAPGALDLGVPLYIDKALAGDRLPAWADGFLTSLGRLDAAAYARLAVSFSRARPVDQDTLMAEWADESQGEKARFVRHLVTATLEGVLGDPLHGGNRSGAGWRAFDVQPDLFAPSEVSKP